MKKIIKYGVIGFSKNQFDKKSAYQILDKNPISSLLVHIGLYRLTIGHHRFNFKKKVYLPNEK